jgi:hypothetical protein
MLFSVFRPSRRGTVKTLIAVVTLLIAAACRAPDDPALREELRQASSTNGLALVGTLGDRIHVIPFNGPQRSFRAPYREPVVAAFASAGNAVLWWHRTQVDDIGGEYRIDSVIGKTVQAKPPYPSEFIPEALNSAGRFLAFGGKLPGINSLRGLYWASFDFSATGFIGEASKAPDWSPDGNALAYEKEGEIYVFDRANGSSMPLVQGHTPTWSPNAELVAFRAPDGHASLVTVAGQVVDWALRDRRPISPLRWSPDGRYVTFAEAVTVPLPLGATSHLVVCRRSDGKAITLRSFGEGAGNYDSFHWIIEYQRFCKECTPGALE